MNPAESTIAKAPASRGWDPAGMTQEQLQVARILAGDEHGFNQLVQQHSGKVLGLAWRLVGNREDAEDLAQEAFLRLHRALPEFRGDSKISTWLYRTTTHLAIDHLRRERLKRKLFFFRSAEGDPDPIDLAPAPLANPAREVEDRQAMQALQRGLLKLSARQQVIFTLRHYEGLPLKEIAGHLGLETGTVKSHLHRAVSVLRRELAEYQEVAP